MAVLLFDSQGTLVDNYTIVDALERHLTGARIAQAVSYDWRQRQKWMMCYLTAAGVKLPMPQINEAAFRWALALHHIMLPDAAIKAVLSQYQELRAYPDVPAALDSLKAQGHTIKIIANPATFMLEGHLQYAGIRKYIDEIVSNSEEEGVFKPHPKVFQLGLRKAGVPQDQCLWVTGHFWEAVGAHHQGFKTAWTNRALLPPDPIGFTPTYTTTTLLELAQRLQEQGGKV